MSEEYILLPPLQGHKAIIWAALETPATLQRLYNMLPNIPKPSIRRNLSEMKRDRYIYKDPPTRPVTKYTNQMTPSQRPTGERIGVIGKGKWKRNGVPASEVGL